MWTMWYSERDLGLTSGLWTKSPYVWPTLYISLEASNKRITYWWEEVSGLWASPVSRWTVYNQSEYIKTRWTIYNQSEYIETRWTIYNQSEYIKIRWTIYNQSEYIKIRSTIYNQSEYIKIKSTIYNQSEYIKIRWTIYDQSEYITIRSTIYDQSEYITIRRNLQLTFCWPKMGPWRCWWQVVTLTVSNGKPSLITSTGW